jgi:hypothetical protein
VLQPGGVHHQAEAEAEVDLAAYDEELGQLVEAAAAVEEAGKVLRRRSLRVERQRAAATAVKKWSGETLEAMTAQADAVRRVGGLVRSSVPPIVC